MDDWMINPKLKNLDPAKLAMLSSLATEGSKKSRSEMMPFLMSLMNNKGSNGIDFSGEEQNLLHFLNNTTQEYYFLSRNIL